jgi:DNA primase
MWEELETLKQRVSLLDFLRQHDWKPCRVGSRQEFVGLCPLHRETRPSFYVNAVKNVFYCHGCGRGGDLIRFAQLYFDLPFRQTIAQLRRELGLVPASESALLDETVRFCQFQLHRYGEAVEYLNQRGLRDPGLLEELSIGYAPGGCLRRHLTAFGHSAEMLLDCGLVNQDGRDTFCRRVVFPCRDHGKVTNLYGRSIGTAQPHRFLSRPKAGLYAWEKVSTFPR